MAHPTQASLVIQCVLSAPCHRPAWRLKSNYIVITLHICLSEEARLAFADPNGLVIDDPDHSEDEERFILLGLSYALHLPVVCHVFRSDAIRIISARKAMPRETQTYRRNR